MGRVVRCVRFEAGLPIGSPANRLQNMSRYNRLVTWGREQNQGGSRIAESNMLRSLVLTTTMMQGFFRALCCDHFLHMKI